MPVEQLRLGRIHGLFVLLDSAQLECAGDACRGSLLMEPAGARRCRLVMQQLGGRVIAVDEDSFISETER
ncbi:hypothetical protein BTZ20_4561 [Rhodococcus sp. MTM3W5.2]|nr:hypothetical protein BTZ20_4561 [Rhodococcus sp. MTM3W5.2]